MEKINVSDKETVKSQSVVVDHTKVVGLEAKTIAAVEQFMANNRSMSVNNHQQAFKIRG